MTAPKQTLNSREEPCRRCGRILYFRANIHDALPHSVCAVCHGPDDCSPPSDLDRLKDEVIKRARTLCEAGKLPIVEPGTYVGRLMSLGAALAALAAASRDGGQ